MDRGKILLNFYFLFLFISSVSSTIREKIFTHERGELATSHLQKLSRIDDTGEGDLDRMWRRALEEFKEIVPTYTGFFFLDLVFDVVKALVVFIMTLLTPVEGPTFVNALTSDGH